ncbi:hypothetical protein [Amphritea balenae]|uniref:Phytanoyl-CoA dioxygenase n=1 Tax=Amphritea balenae TaxID=452629 RepID=A0A3P1SS44_9GAMM|nr:hypothetical protein [Amphritea balenae]RRD00004.1 hypothetical protein EHS89_07260 [Amphritea balenae]GGK75804.1 hypothetical protein GCM10007941_27430 [Amphritea balenae]
MQVHEFGSPITDVQRSQILFNGDLIVFKQLPALAELNRQVDYLIQEIQGHPRSYLLTIEQGREHDSKYLQLMQQIQQTFAENSLFSELFYRALYQVGVDAQANYADKLFLRSVPPLAIKQPDNPLFRGGIRPHRDTWGSNIQQQINWWSPVYPVTEQNSIVFYPAYWDSAVVNSTASWSFDAFCRARKNAEKGQTIGYPYAPQVLEPIEDIKQQVVVIEPGDLLCFSSAHLHASVPNNTGLTRYSYELRSFNLDDIAQQRMPVNVDNAATKPHYNWFNRMSEQSGSEVNL